MPIPSFVETAEAPKETWVSPRARRERAIDLKSRILPGIPVKGDGQGCGHLAAEPEVVHEGPASVDKGLHLTRDRGDVHGCGEQDAVRFEHLLVDDLHVVLDAAVILLYRNRDDVEADLLLHLVYPTKAGFTADAVLDPVVLEMNELGRCLPSGLDHLQRLFEVILAVAVLDRRAHDAQDFYLQIVRGHGRSFSEKRI